jgi:TolB-like protein
MAAILINCWSESDQEAIRKQLDRILKSGPFHQSRRRQRFLEYIVNETLAGRGERLKGYSIALAVFDRTETFDSTIDPIVRAEAARLRDRLREYYEVDGPDDPVHIELPKGHYTPHIEFRQAATSDASPDRPDGTHAATQDQSPNLAEVPAALGNGPASPASARSQRDVRRQIVMPAIVLAALLAVAAAGAFYLRQPPAFWASLLGDSGGLLFPESPAIAVLPFDDMSATGDQQYLADGITEELITGLAKFPEFMVMARNSTLAYKDKPTDIRQVGKDLNVRYVVEGTIQRFDQNVRVTAQLIDASTGRHLWADRYDREATGIFAVRDDITRSIAGVLGGLQGEVGRAEAARLSAKSPNSFTVYDYVMRGWYELYKYEQEANKVARDFFEQAKKIDPSYARTYTGLGWTYADDFLYEWTDDHEKTLKLALENASTAVRLDPNDYQAHWILGWAYLYSGEHEKALASYLRARKLNPNDAELLAEMGSLLIYIGQPKQAIEQVKEAIRLNPYHEPWYTHYLGWAYENYGMPREAIETLEPVIDEPPTKEQLWILPTLAAAYADPTVGRMNDAHKIVAAILSLQPEFSTAEVASRNPYNTKELVDRYVNALRRAGLPE